MTKPYLSGKTRHAFADAFSQYYRVRDIDVAFCDAGIALDLDFTPSVSGERRTRVFQHYNTINFSRWDDVRKLLRAYEDILDHLERLDPNHFDSSFDSHDNLVLCLGRDGLVYDGSRISRADQTGVDDALTSFDLPELQRQIERMRSSVDDDPRLAIGTAKELIETTCKTILADRHVAFPASADLPQLLKLTRRNLQLLPDDISDSAKGATSIRRLLSSLGTVGQGLGEVRNLYGTGHGKDGRSSAVSPRIARLAVGSSATLATFLLETHRERE